MQHLLVRHSARVAVIAVFVFRRNAETILLQDISERFSPQEPAAGSAARLWTTLAQLEPGNSMLKGGKRARVPVPI
jgi:hypothetical protein